MKPWEMEWALSGLGALIMYPYSRKWSRPSLQMLCERSHPSVAPCAGFSHTN
jgi:hypothetical protein